MNTLHAMCPLCAQEARVVTERKELIVGRRKVEIDDEYMQCDSCHESFYSAEQSALLEKRAKAQATIEENLLSPADVKKIRKSLNFTQGEFDELLGVGEKSSARWETGRVRQNITTDRLIRLLAANRKNVEMLAAINGVALKDSCFVPEPTAQSRGHETAPFLPAFQELTPRITLEGTAEESTLTRRDFEAATALLRREHLLQSGPLAGPVLEAARHFDTPFPPTLSKGRSYDH